MTTDPTGVPSAGSPSPDPPPRKRGYVKWIAIAVFTVIVCVLAIIWFNLNGIVKRTIETQATNSLDLKTTLAGATVSIFGGSVHLFDLAIASPEGYSAPHMLALGGAGVKVQLGELRQDPVHIS